MKYLFIIGAVILIGICVAILFALCINSGRISREEENQKWKNWKSKTSS